MTLECALKYTNTHSRACVDVHTAWTCGSQYTECSDLFLNRSAVTVREAWFAWERYGPRSLVSIHSPGAQLQCNEQFLMLLQCCGWSPTSTQPLSCSSCPEEGCAFAGMLVAAGFFKPLQNCILLIPPLPLFARASADNLTEDILLSG